MTDSSKMAAHTFFIGFFVGVALVVMVAIYIAETPPPLHLESILPRTCIAGEKVIVTTPTPVEFYMCEAVWKRR